MRFGLWMAIVGLASCEGGGPLVNPTGDTGTGTTSTGVTRINAILALTGVANDGALNFNSQCRVCHPTDGSFGINGEPPLNQAVPIRTDAQLAAVLLAGVTTATGTITMPDYAEYFTNQQISDLLAYMRLTFPAR